jgi:serine/threonine protein kinase
VTEAWIDRYQLHELVSRGGMGEVWRAYDEVLERPVAVKALYEQLGDSADRERFLREARAAARLNHPNIVATHDIGEWDDRPYLVMEYLTGRTLAQDLEERGPLPIADIRAFGAQAAAALECAHEAGIVHRDVKPANLMLTADGDVKLIDFGLAWVVDADGERLTPDNTAMGTVAYLAPELATGAPVDERSDLYSLGCVLYELACGRPPFVGSMAAVVLGHVQDEPDPPSTLRPDIPADLEALILHLLAKDPDHRAASAGAVRRRLLGVDGVARIPQPRKEIAPRPKRMTRLLVGGLMVAAVIGLVVWWALPGIGQYGPAIAETIKPAPGTPTTRVSYQQQQWPTPTHPVTRSEQVAEPKPKPKLEPSTPQTGEPTAQHRSPERPALPAQAKSHRPPSPQNPENAENAENAGKNAAPQARDRSKRGN